MKSKSFDLKHKDMEKNRNSRSFDFVNFYKPAAETSNQIEKQANGDKENTSNLQTNRPYANKKKEKHNVPLDTTHVNIDGNSLNASLFRNSPAGEKVTSTPKINKDLNRKPTVKSIMKHASVEVDEAIDGSFNEPSSSTKTKKRNKSVSFMLEDGEEIVIKKTKSEDNVLGDKNSSKRKNKSKINKHLKLKKESNKIDCNNLSIKVQDVRQVRKEKSDIVQPSSDIQDSSLSGSEVTVQEKNKKVNKNKKRKIVEDSSEPNVTEETSITDVQVKPKKDRKRKNGHKQSSSTSNESVNDNVRKIDKIEVKPEAIVENLENLSIGDNPHTLVSLIDEMSVVDKSKKKILKKRIKKIKKDNVAKKEDKSNTDQDSNENNEAVEKVKWKKRKWNKDKKGDLSKDNILTSVIVENLPISIMLTYKKLLSDHFGTLGIIKKIGVAEVHPAAEPTPVFTTTVQFYSEGAAELALQENGKLFEGNIIRVKRPLPATDTTLVVRAYADLSEQSLSSLFTEAGRIRNIRHLVKGKKSIATVFVEMDGPEAVERALILAKGVKIDGKKIHVSRYEQRLPKKASGTESLNNEDGAESSD